MTAPSDQPASTIRLRFLDGLRGWGALTVVAYHTFIEVFPISTPVRDLLWKAFFFNGLFAVAIFFVVSGMSLSIGYLSSGDKTNLMRLGFGRYFRLTIPIFLAGLITWAAAVSGATVDAVHRENAASLTIVAVRIL